MHKLTIELSELQLDAVLDALEMYSRIGIGQLEYIAEQSAVIACKEKPMEMNYTNPKWITFQKKLNECKALFGWNSSSHAGIYSANVSADVKRAWIVYKSIKHARAWMRKPDGGWHLDFDEPLRNSTESMPRVKIESA